MGEPLFPYKTATCIREGHDSLEVNSTLTDPRLQCSE